ASFLGYIAAMITVPPEWAPHKAIWTAWPSHPELWAGLALARQQVADMVKVLAKDEPVMVLAMGNEAEKSARTAFKGTKAVVISAKFGDIWLRDTAPIFARDDGKPVALTFQLNGWGGKYIYEFDDQVSAFVAQQSKTRAVANDFVMEGGSVE